MYTMPRIRRHRRRSRKYKGGRDAMPMATTATPMQLATNPDPHMTIAEPDARTRASIIHLKSKPARHIPSPLVVPAAYIDPDSTTVSETQVVPVTVLSKPEIILNAHQIVPAYKLVATDRRGLLLWYLMGTGKTLSAITLILNFPDRVVNVVCPEVLVFVWKSELAKVPAVKNKVQYYTYNDMAPFFARESLANEILIIDEAHNLVADHMMKISADNKVSGAQRTRLIRSSYRRLLLSGTPLHSGVAGLAMTLNLCAESDIFPNNNTDFIREFYTISIERTAKWGFGVPLMQHIIGWTGALSFTVDMSKYVSKLFGLIGNSFNEVDMFNRGMVRKLTGLGSLREAYSGSEEEMGSRLIKAIGDNMSMFGSMAMAMPKPLIALVGINIVWWFILQAKYNLDYIRNDFKDLNVAKFVESAQDYVMYYTVNVGENGYPHVNKYQRMVSYTWYQLKVWLELTHGDLPLERVIELEVTAKDDASSHTPELDFNTYMSFGVAIGNLIDKSTNPPTHSNKFEHIYETARGKRAVFYSQFTTAGSLLLKDFFINVKGISPIYIDYGLPAEKVSGMLEKFKNAKGECFLILHPKYTEGISILGAQQMHLIEPIRTNSMCDQIIARVVRFMSHAHLPPEEQVVDVFQWGCNMDGQMNHMKKLFASVQTWYALKVPMLYTEQYNMMSQNHTPDAIVLRRAATAAGEKEALTNAFLDIEFDDPTCCVVFPSKTQESDCRRTRKSCDAPS